MNTEFRCRSILLILAGTSLILLGIYWQVETHEFIGIDDGEYIYKNPVISRGLSIEGLSWAVTTFHASNWHPLTWFSHMLDVELFGLNPGWHHRMNAILHLLNTHLLFLVLWRMSGGFWQSALAASLFGIHPLHVESVAWVAERKDLLSTLFWILTMGGYYWYARGPRLNRYLVFFGFFAMGLMSKPMLVSLPFVLLLLDVWPLGRVVPTGCPGTFSWRYVAAAFPRLLLEKIPLLVLSVASCVITILAQSKGGAVKLLEGTPPGIRVANAVVSYATYLWKTVWPAKLAVFYPHPAVVGFDIPAWKVAGATLLILFFSGFTLSQAKPRPYLAVGWFWFLGTMIPVIGLVPIGGAAMADRYTYVPLIGVFIALAWGVPSFVADSRFRSIGWRLAGGVLIMAFSMVSWTQVGYWRNNLTLYNRALSVTERNWLVLHNLGVTYYELGDTQRSIAYLWESLGIRPNNAFAWFNLGVAYNKLGNSDLANECFEAARMASKESSPVLIP